MSRGLQFAYGVITYALFFVGLRYFVFAVENSWVARRIDGPARAPFAHALLVDNALLLLFAVQHSVMARPRFKAWLTRCLPPALERSTYVLFSTAALALLVFAWQPITWRLWQLEGTAAVAVRLLSYGGWIFAAVATWQRGHPELFGLHQVNAVRKGRTPVLPPLQTHGLYGLMRHPMYFGFLVAVWAAPVMTGGHLLLAAALTLYTLIGLRLEERDLSRRLGDEHAAYRRRVGPFWPRTPRGDRSPGPSPA